MTTPIEDLAEAATLYTANADAMTQLLADLATARAELDSVIADPESDRSDIDAANEAHRQLAERIPDLGARRASILTRAWRAVVRSGLVAGFTGAGPTLPAEAAWLPTLPKGAAWPPIGPDEVLTDWD